MGKINSAAKSAFAGVSHHSLSQIFLMSSALNHRGAFRYWWFTSRTRKRPEIWGGEIKTKFHLSELSCVFEVACGKCWPQMSGRSSFPRDCLTRVVKWETKIHNAVTPAFVLLLAPSIWMTLLPNLFKNNPGFAELFEECNLCPAGDNFPSPILEFMAQVLFIP